METDVSRKSPAAATAAVWLLAACASPGSAGPGPAQPVDTSQARLHVYEVPLEGRQAADTIPSFVEVSGTGTAEVEPDRAVVAFAVETSAETAADAAGANADLMTAVLGAVRAGGFAGLELETFGYSLRPEYATPDQRVRTIAAYTALNHVRATVADVDAVGGVIDAAIGAGANRVTQIHFEASDVEAARTEALQAAVRAARAQAEAIASALGHELGRALEVRGGADRPGPRPYAMDMVSMRAEATPIEAGSQTVTANVTVRFALGAERPER